MVAKQGDTVRDQSPHRLDEPTRGAKRVKELPPGISHSQSELDKIENRDIDEVTGALHGIRRADHPFQSTPFTGVLTNIARLHIRVAFLYECRQSCMRQHLLTLPCERT